MASWHSIFESANNSGGDRITQAGFKIHPKRSIGACAYIVRMRHPAASEDISARAAPNWVSQTDKQFWRDPALPEAPNWVSQTDKQFWRDPALPEAPAQWGMAACACRLRPTWHRRRIPPRYRGGL